MAAMKPRTGDGPMEVTKEARSLVMRIPLEGGGRLVVELNQEEARNLADVLNASIALPSDPTTRIGKNSEGILGKILFSIYSSSFTFIGKR